MNKRPLTRVRGAREAGVTWRGDLAHPPRGGCASTCIGLDGGQFCIRLRATCESREYHSVVRCPHAPWFPSDRDRARCRVCACMQYGYGPRIYLPGRHSRWNRAPRAMSAPRPTARVATAAPTRITVITVRARWGARPAPGPRGACSRISSRVAVPPPCRARPPVAGPPAPADADAVADVSVVSLAPLGLPSSVFDRSRASHTRNCDLRKTIKLCPGPC